MRLRSFLLVSSLAPLAGCHLATNIARNAYNEPAEIHDEYSVEHQLRKEAKAAFAEVKRQYPRRSFCDDFEDGFIDGYSDFLDRGGKAEMPAMPPLKYRRAKYLNPEGHAKIKDYFLGFKYGMEVAVATGCRPFYTFPILLPEQSELPPLNITVLPPPPDQNAPMPKLGAPLPLPTESAKPNAGTNSVAPTPGLGNPVVPKPAESGTVPIPSNLLPKQNSPANPAGPGGKSAQSSASETPQIMSVSGFEVMPIPQPEQSGPFKSIPEPRSPIFDLPPAKPLVR